MAKKQHPKQRLCYAIDRGGCLIALVNGRRVKAREGLDPKLLFQCQDCGIAMELVVIPGKLPYYRHPREMLHVCEGTRCCQFPLGRIDTFAVALVDGKPVEARADLDVTSIFRCPDCRVEMELTAKPDQGGKVYFQHPPYASRDEDGTVRFPSWAQPA